MKKFKKVVTILLSLSLCLVLFACAGEGGGGGGGGGDKPPITPEVPSTPMPTVVSSTQLLSELSADGYKDFITTSEPMGLSSAFEVGVDKDKMNETLYPVPKDSEFTKIFKVEDYGILPSAKSNSAAMKQLVSELKKTEGLKKVQFSKGVYQFDSTIEFYDVSDLYLVGEETTEWMITEWTTAMVINKCKNFHINNIDFDYLISPTIAGTVLSTNSQNSTVTILVDEEFDMSSYYYNGGAINYGNYMEYLKDDTFGGYVPDHKGMLRYNSTGDRVKGIENGVYNAAEHTLTLTFNAVQGAFKAPKVGKVVSVGYTMYEYATFTMHDSEDYFMESCNIYTSAGMTFMFHSTKNIYLNRTNLVLREGSMRRMTATADGLHTNDCYGDLFVTNSIYEASHDDSMNICTFYKTVNTVQSNVISAGAASPVTNFPINKGDVIDIYNNAMEVVGTYTVTDVFNSGLSCEITVDRRVRNVSSGFHIGNITRNPNLKINNCIFRNKRNRGILAQVQNAEISNCAFINVIHGPIMLHSAFDIFAEGIIPKNIVVKNNKFLQNNQGYGLNGDVSSFRNGGEIKPSTIKEIEVSNNFFHLSSRAAVHLNSNADSKVLNNLFFNTNVQTDNVAIAVDLSSGTTIKDNFAYFTRAFDAFKIIREGNNTNTSQANNRVEIKA